MKQEQLELFLRENGYRKISSNLPEYALFFRPECQGINVINVVDCTKNAYLSSNQYDYLHDKIKDVFLTAQGTDIHILSLIISEESKYTREVCLRDPFCWIVSPTKNELVIYEGQTPDFYGMKQLLEVFLQKGAEVDVQPFENEAEQGSWKQVLRKNVSYMTVIFVVLNAVLFILCAFNRNLLYNIGDLYVPAIVGKKEYYRLISSLFLHTDAEHLFSNILILYYVGKEVEKKIGRIRFGILYMVSGIMGGITSMLYELFTLQYSHSVGASGAVFGVMGALLVLVCLHRGKMEAMTGKRVAFMVFFSLYSGFRAEHINNAAHLGGVLAGMICMLLLWITMRKESGLYED